MSVRRATTDDVPALIAFPDTPGVQNLPRDQVRDDFATGRMRPEWSWLAENDGRLVGRALWWGLGGSRPESLDTLDVLPEQPDPRSVAAQLLQGGRADLGQLPTYRLRIPVGERHGHPVRWRCEAAQDAGLTETLERLQYQWSPPAGVPQASTRLTFREGSDEEFVSLFGQAARGSLDVETRRALEETDEISQARDDLAFYLSCPGERDWWRVAFDHEHQPAGFIVPSATPYHRNVGYLGVLPDHRGQGLVHDLLGEITRIHAAAGAQRITATTDLVNLPMAAAFDRAGYQITEIRLVLQQPRVGS
ncbi:GNAT family N-acetyltransferase [Kineosporia babensis]|uniref:GNAT family N-acetyltransferase n=1 Tax=Kineosporia babensis TaxID=499548 RepID=A0A9X1NB05_9ACTN|nr:GNAT family N-acetyltransferase [Kineosporia babensis]MCD5311897.1 GNAT family N-acetyltransferase [Kineosporia babensis]